MDAQKKIAVFVDSDAEKSDMDFMPLAEDPIDFESLSRSTHQAEYDLRLEYETNPPIFFKNYYISLSGEPLFAASLPVSQTTFDDVPVKGSSFSEEGLIDTFYVDNPNNQLFVNGFINIGEYHDRVDLRALFEQLKCGPGQRAQKIQLSQQGDAVHLSIEGLPEFGVMFIDSASNRADDFAIGTDILIE